MVIEPMRVNLPGLTRERLRSGRYSWRVRVKGDKARKITLGVDPDHPEFAARYEAARRGEKYVPPERRGPIPRSVAWLSLEFEKAMQQKVSAGLLSAATLAQRRYFFDRLRSEYGAKHMEMPRAKLIELRDTMVSTPGAADNMIKAVRAMYAWATERGLVSDNPAIGIPRINHGTGAVPWSIDDLRAFRERHPAGTMPHLALTLFMFTACRIGDAYRLGRDHEIIRDGVTHLSWQPAKKGSAKVTIPILPPLAKAIAAQKVISRGPYLLTSHGLPFASSAALGNWFRERVEESGLTGRSPHGIRKAAGELLALEGATQYHIMAIHGHTQAKTSETYTRGVNRERLGQEAMELLRNFEW